MAKRTRARQHTTARDYPRTARLNQLFHEILAEELEKVDDDRLELVTIMSVDCESDLRHAAGRRLRRAVGAKRRPERA